MWVIDAKRYRGRPELRVEGGLLRPRVDSLRVGGRDQTKLVVGVHRQIELVRTVVDGVPVAGALCFVQADWPLFGGSFIVQGVHALWPRKLADRIVRACGDIEVSRVAEVLAGHFPSAT